MSARATDPDRLLSVEQIAELTGLSRRTVYREITDGNLTAYRIRSRVLVPADEYTAWLDAHRLHPRSRPHPQATARIRPPKDGLRQLLKESHAA